MIDYDEISDLIIKNIDESINKIEESLKLLEPIKQTTQEEENQINILTHSLSISIEWLERNRKGVLFFKKVMKKSKKFRPENYRLRGRPKKGIK